MERIFWAASAQGNARAIRQCISKKIDVNAKNTQDNTAVFFAAQNGHYKCIEMLFNNGADINLQNKDGWTPVMFASQHGHEIAALTLIASGADLLITTKDHGSALLLSVQQKHLQIAKHLIAALRTGYSVSKTSEIIYNAFIWSIALNHIEMFDMLLAATVDIDIAYEFSNSDNGTALILACRLGHNKIVQKLIGHGADVTYAPFGKSPMEEAMPKTKKVLQKALKSK